MVAFGLGSNASYRRVSCHGISPCSPRMIRVFGCFYSTLHSKFRQRKEYITYYNTVDTFLFICYCLYVSIVTNIRKEPSMTIEEMNRIKEERGYSFDLLSRYTGVPRATLVNVLTGVTANPRIATVAAIEEVLSGPESVYPGRRFKYHGDSEVLHDDTDFGFFSVQQAESAMTDDICRMSAEEFQKTDFHYPCELIDGLVIRMAYPTTHHAEISQFFYDAFRDYIRAHHGDCRLRIGQSGVKLDVPKEYDTVVSPDFYVVCDQSKIKEKWTEGAPDFVLEVASPSNSRNDYVVKMAKYEKCGVKEYWIVDPVRDRLVIYDFMQGEEMCPQLLPVSGKVPVAIYHGDLVIDLDRMNEELTKFD